MLQKLWQGRCEGFEARLLPNVAFEGTRKALGKRPECCKSLRRRPARQLKPGYCPQNAATACGKGAATPEASACPAIAWALLGRAPPAIVWGRRISVPFHEAAAAPSCDTVRLTVRLACFFPNNAGLVPVLTEAPWKKMAQVTVVQLIPNEV